MSTLDTQQEATSIARPNPTPRIYGVVLGVGVLCSLAIVTTYELTRPVIRQNKIDQRRQAILDVVPDATTIGTFGFDTEKDSFYRESEDSESSELVFAGFDEAGSLVGIAMPAQGMGYQDNIQFLYGYSPAKEAVIGIRVLESRETPGLGDRIEKDPQFLKNFEQLDASLSEDGETLSHPIEFVKAGEKTDAWQIDGITGATISSRAVADTLRQSTNQWVPRIQRHQEQLQADRDGGGA